MLYSIQQPNAKKKKSQCDQNAALKRNQNTIMPQVQTKYISKGIKQGRRIKDSKQRS